MIREPPSSLQAPPSKYRRTELTHIKPGARERSLVRPPDRLEVIALHPHGDGRRRGTGGPGNQYSKC